MKKLAKRNDVPGNTLEAFSLRSCWCYCDACTCNCDCNKSKPSSTEDSKGQGKGKTQGGSNVNSKSG